MSDKDLDWTPLKDEVICTIKGTRLGRAWLELTFQNMTPSLLEVLDEAVSAGIPFTGWFANVGNCLFGHPLHMISLALDESVHDHVRARIINLMVFYRYLTNFHSPHNDPISVQLQKIWGEETALALSEIALGSSQPEVIRMSALKFCDRCNYKRLWEDKSLSDGMRVSVVNILANTDTEFIRSIAASNEWSGPIRSAAITWMPANDPLCFELFTDLSQPEDVRVAAIQKLNSNILGNHSIGPILENMILDESESESVRVAAMRNVLSNVLYETILFARHLNTMKTWIEKPHSQRFLEMCWDLIKPRASIKTPIPVTLLRDLSLSPNVKLEAFHNYANSFIFSSLVK